MLFFLMLKVDVKINQSLIIKFTTIEAYIRIKLLTYELYDSHISFGSNWMDHVLLYLPGKFNSKCNNIKVSQKNSNI